MKIEKATFAAGCFWGVQFYFDSVPGVIKSLAGYTGGHTANPTYEQVCARGTGHAEAVELEFDPEKVSYEVLVRHFFRLHDPTQLNRQGPDIGDQYRSSVFYHDESQRTSAEKIKKQLQNDYDKPIVTTIVPAGTFYEAEEYHQKYTEKTGYGACRVPYQPLSG